MKKRRFLAVGLSLVMMLSLICGCGSGDSDSGGGEGNAQSISDEGTSSDGDASGGDDVYTVDMYLMVPVEVPSGMDAVLEKVNEITMREVNMKLNLTYLSFAAATTQIPLMLSSGEKIDIIASGSASASSYVSSGYLLNLEDLLPEVEDSLKASYGGADVTWANVNGYIYGVPMHKDLVMQPTIFFAKDILEKHDLVEEAQSLSSLEEIDAFFEKVSELEPGMWMTAPEVNGRMKTILYDGLGDYFGVIRDFENNTTVENLFETEEFYEYCNYMHKWFQNGWVSQSAATDTESYYTYIKNGQAFSFFSDFSHPLSLSDQQANCGGKELVMVPIGPKYQTTETMTQFTYCIPSGSENPQKAMEMINFMANSPEINNLLNWGIEGVDYVVTEDGHAAFPEGKDANSVSYHLDAGWILPNQFLCHPWEGKDLDIYEQIEDYNSTDVIQSKVLGLQWDSSSVANELAAVTNVRDKYYKEITTGSVDPEEFIPRFNEELYAAGLDKIIAEKQAQVDAFLAGNN